MPFSISQFIRVNRVYFIWAVFMLLLYLSGTCSGWSLSLLSCVLLSSA